MAKEKNILQENLEAVREVLFKIYRMGQRATELEKRGVKLTDAQLKQAQNSMVDAAVDKITTDATLADTVVKALDGMGDEMRRAGQGNHDLTRRFSRIPGNVEDAAWVNKLKLSKKELDLKHSPDIFTRARQAIEDTPDSFRSLADGVRLATNGERFKAGAMATGSLALGADAIRRATTQAPEGQSRGKRIAFAAVEGITAAALGIAAITKITADVRMFGADNLRAAGAGQSR